MRLIILSSFLFVAAFTAKAQIYLGQTSKISFYSESKVEDIDATSTTTMPVLNTISNELVFKISNTSFHFKSALMEEHFNENYIESEKYPFSIFKGKINEKIDYTKDGEHDVTVTGKMNIHGVEKDVTMKGKVTVKSGKILLNSKFKIKLSDYNISVPSVVAYNVAEEVDVTVEATLAPYVKK
jgi:hypothetical protein